MTNQLDAAERILKNLEDRQKAIEVLSEAAEKEEEGSERRLALEEQLAKLRGEEVSAVDRILEGVRARAEEERLINEELEKRRDELTPAEIEALEKRRDILRGGEDDESPLPDEMDQEDFYGDLARGTADAIETGITEGGDAGVNALKDLLAQVLVPLLENIFANAAGGAGGGGGGGGFLGTLFGNIGGGGGSPPIVPTTVQTPGALPPPSSRGALTALAGSGGADGQPVISIFQGFLGDPNAVVARSMLEQAQVAGDVIWANRRENRIPIGGRG